MTFPEHVRGASKQKRLSESVANSNFLCQLWFLAAKKFSQNYGSSTGLKVVTRPSFWYGLDTLQNGQKSPKNFYGISLQKEPEEWKEGPFFRAFNTLFKLVIFGWQPHIWARAAVESSSLRRGISLRISSALGATFVRFFSAGQRRRRRKKAFFDNERVNKEEKNCVLSKVLLVYFPTLLLFDRNNLRRSQFWSAWSYFVSESKTSIFTHR